MSIPRAMLVRRAAPGALGLIMLLVSAAVPAASLLTLKTENDNYAGAQDGHYTNGVELIWAFSLPEQHWLRGLADVLPGMATRDLVGGAYRFTHQMYTPEEIKETRLIEEDRPYAGVVLGGVSLFGDRRRDGWRELTSLTLDAGVVGPAAGGKWLQREVHALTGSDEPRGWRHQLDNEPVVNLGYKRSWIGQAALDGYEVEYGPSAGLALGNLYTYASTGLGVRLGQNLERSLGIPAIAPSQGGRATFRAGQGFSWYAFAAVEGRYMAHNLLLDGNTFTESHSVDCEAWVGDALAGVALTWDRWQLTYTHAWRTDEFVGQAEHDTFGSLSISRWF